MNELFSKGHNNSLAQRSGPGDWGEGDEMYENVQRVTGRDFHCHGRIRLYRMVGIGERERPTTLEEDTSRGRTSVSYRNAETHQKHCVNNRPTGDNTQKDDWVSTPDKIEQSRGATGRKRL